MPFLKLLLLPLMITYTLANTHVYKLVVEHTPTGRSCEFTKITDYEMQKDEGSNWTDKRVQFCAWDLQEDNTDDLVVKSLTVEVNGELK